MGSARGFAMMSVVVGLVLIAGAVLLVSHQSQTISAESRAFEDATALDHLLDTAETHARWQLQQQACVGYAPFSASYGGNSYSASYQPAAGSPVEISLTASHGEGLSGTRVLSGASAYDELQSTTLVSSVTSYIREDQNTVNQGDHKDIHVGVAATKQRRGLVTFNLASLPQSAVVEKATLRVNVNGAGQPGDVISIRRVTRWWTEDEVTWDEARSGTDWSTPGGDYHWVEHGQFIADIKEWKEADVTELVRGWVDGTYSNHGMIFMSDNPSGTAEFKFLTEDEPENIELVVEHKCECGGTCGVNAFVACDANYRVNSEGAVFAPAVTAPMTGIAAVPGNVTIMGVSFGADGGIIVPDNNQLEAFDADGTPAGTCNPTIAGDMVGLSYALRGPYQEQLVVLEDTPVPTLHLIGENCQVDQTLNVTGSALTNATGVSYLTLDAGHPYEDHFALTDSDGNLEFLTAGGAAVASATIDFPATGVSGLAHVYNQDRLLLLNNATEEVYNVDFSGQVHDRYDYTRFGSDTPEGIAVNPLSCEHLLPSEPADEVVSLYREPLPTEPIAHWRLDEVSGNVAEDSAGPHDAVLGGGGTWEPTGGAVQGALLINLPNEGGIVADVSSLDRDGSLTVAGWISASGNGPQPIVSRYDAFFDHNYKLGLNDMEPEFTLYNGSTQTLTSPVTLNDNEWYHLAGTYDATLGRARLYLNGTLLLSQSVAGPLIPTPGYFNLGQTFFGGITVNGRIDDVMLFDVALEEEDVVRLYGEAPGPVGAFTPPAGGNTLGCTSDTYADDFADSGWFTWPGSTGTLSWSGGWTEIGDTGSPLSGDVRKDNNRIHNTRSARFFGASKGLSRTADLSPFASGVVRFDYTRLNLESNDEIVISAGNSGGLVELGRIVGETGVFDSQSNPKEAEFTIPASHLTSDAYVQIVNGAAFSSGEGAYIDNFVIEGCPP